MDFRIQGKRALVTGASLGIGRAVAADLAAEGCDVAMVAREAGRLEQAAKEIAAATGRKIVALPCDISKIDLVAPVVDQARSLLGGIDILVNNAGSTPEDGIDMLDYAKWRYSFELKVLGYARFAELVLPEMRERKWGRVVNVIGRTGHQPRPVYLAGGSINAGLLNLTKALAEAAAKDNVLVTGVNPGPIDTPRWATVRQDAVNRRGVTAQEFDAKFIAGVPLGRLGLAEEVSAVVVFLCSDRSSFIAGEIVNVDGGGTRCI